MGRRSKPRDDTLELAKDLAELIAGFPEQLRDGDIRSRVKSLIPAFHMLRDLGSSLIPASDADSARDRIFFYFKRYPRTVLEGDELMVVSGINEWPRRIRELRVQFGWMIYSGLTLREIAEDSAEEAQIITDGLGIRRAELKPDQYVLADDKQDLEAAYRWNTLNLLRRKKGSVQSKILDYLRMNVGKPISGEELRYLAKDKKEWARRSRELRTEEGWPVATRMSGRRDLPVGVYVLEEDKQAEPHDRHIEDAVRVAVLKRDGHACTVCDWTYEQLLPGDPRKLLELHHVKFHEHKGGNTEENLITLCNVHHHEVHRRSKKT